jgi:hypothetical protein
MTDETLYWQPIETAPKDGSTILLRQGKWAPVSAYWHVNEWRYIDYAHPSRPTHWAIPPHAPYTQTPASLGDTAGLERSK